MSHGRRTISALILLQLLAGPLAAQRLAPPRFAPVAARAAPAPAPQRPGASEDRFSLPLFVLSGVAGCVAGAFLGVAATGGVHEDAGMPAVFIGGALGFSIGATWYALTH